MSGRSPEEREAARLERERKRAAQRGEPLPSVPAPPAEVPVERPPEPEPVAAAPAARPDALDAGAAQTPAPPPPPRRSFPSPRPSELDEEAPIGTVRPSAGAPGMPQRPVTVRRRRRRPPGRLVFLFVVVGIIAAIALFFVWSVYNPFTGDGSGRVVVVVKPGSSASQIGDQLARRGVVGSGFFFSLRAAISGDRENLRAGRYTLREGMSNGAALAVLTAEPKTAKTIDVLIPEGPGRREVAPLVEQAGVSGSYLQASARSPALRPRRYGAPPGASLEGFLFPATYELRASRASASRLVREQLRAFKQNFATVNLRRARRKNLTAYDVLIIASMIERETAVAQRAPARRRGHLQPPGAEDPARHRRHDALCGEQLDPAAEGLRARARLAVQHPPAPGPAAVADRQSRDRLDPRRREPGDDGLPVLRREAVRQGRARRSRRPTPQFQRDVAAYNAKRQELGGKDPSVCPKN